jgi:hypothetical protein
MASFTSIIVHHYRGVGHPGVADEHVDVVGHPSRRCR